ncbi:MAG TPA: DUF4388 domain-containing protein [Pyrinomonadaceae bacterium]|jgi:hypothetical protein|nr:DUF4388 domain-containing protein [Pyrinomonadaceae bacterium]
MALSGQLSDLSLAELIEFFCNQRKTGRLKVAYERAPGYFYFDRGDLVDAKIGSLNGIEAIYYALTLANASFKFSPAFEPTRRSIHQPWTQVTLEGLRRLDEGIKPKEPTVEEGVLYTDDPDGVNETAVEVEFDSDSPLPLSQTVSNAASGGRSKMVFAAVAVVVIALVAVIGIPAGWFSKGKTAVAAQPATAPEAQASNAKSNNAEEASQPDQSAVDPASADAASLNDANALAARRAREARDRARLAEAAAARQNAAANSPAAPASNVEAVKKPDAIKPGPKMVSVQVTYDEAGRVTQTSGGDGTAQRIARQKRFPAGKAGSTTITIPIN